VIEQPDRLEPQFHRCVHQGRWSACGGSVFRFFGRLRRRAWPKRKARWDFGRYTPPPPPNGEAYNPRDSGRFGQPCPFMSSPDAPWRRGSPSGRGAKHEAYRRGQLVFVHFGVDFSAVIFRFFGPISSISSISGCRAAAKDAWHDRPSARVPRGESPSPLFFLLPRCSTPYF